MAVPFALRPPIISRPAPALHHVQVDESGLRLAVTEWRSVGTASTTYVFLHATGFHSRCWDAAILKLPPDTHCYAVDVRGHGRSDKPEPIEGVYPWHLLAADVMSVLRHFNIKGAIGVGHSMGGYIALAAAVADKSFFKGLLLVDPVVFRAEAYMAEAAASAKGSTSAVSHRFNRFTSPAHMYERLFAKGSYRAWRPECLSDYCAYGLLPSSAVSAATGWSPPGASIADIQSSPHMLLACPPHIEAATYAGSRGRSDRDRYKDLQMPVIILRAERGSDNHTGDRPGGSNGMDWTKSPTDPELWKLFPNVRDVHLTNGMTHFIPMQDPDVVVSHLRGLAGHSQGTSICGSSKL